MVNWAIYSYNVNRGHSKANDSDTCDAMYKQDRPSASDSDSISITELLMPMSLSLLLSLIHSQIVATSSLNLSKADKGKKNPLQLHRKKRERRKRRKTPSRCKSTLNAPADILNHARSPGDTAEACKEPSSIGQRATSQKLAEKLEPMQAQLQPVELQTGEASQLRKRNVNWCTSIKNSSINYAALGKQQGPAFGGPGRLMTDGVANADDEMHGDDNDFETVTTAADDDGFESLNGKSSSGEEMSAIGGRPNEEAGSTGEVAASVGQPSDVCTYLMDALNGGKDIDNSGSIGTIISENVSEAI